MRTRDYIAHRLVGTPLERMAAHLRHLAEMPRERRHPELNGVYTEKALIRRVYERVIKDPMNCVDGGAHIGMTLARMRQMSPNGHHIAFEPIAYKAAWIRRKFLGVEVREQALSNVTGEAPFYLNSWRSGFSSLATRGPGEVDQITVERVRLDDVVPRDRPIGFIKLNVQGMELNALRGAPEMLNRYRPTVIFHCSHDGMEVSDCTADDVYGYVVREHGYLLYKMGDFLGGNDPLSLERFKRAMEYPFQAFHFLAIADNSTGLSTGPSTSPANANHTG